MTTPTAIAPTSTPRMKASIGPAFYITEGA